MNEKTVKSTELVAQDFFEFQNIRLSYHRFNATDQQNGKVVLFFHGNGYPSLSYMPLFRDLTGAGYTVYALDFMGHGDSQVTDDFDSWYFFRDQILAFLDHLGFSEVYAAGHSLGGASLLLAASLDVDRRMKQIALLDPVILTPWMFAECLPVQT